MGFDVAFMNMIVNYTGAYIAGLLTAGVALFVVFVWSVALSRRQDKYDD